MNKTHILIASVTIGLWVVGSYATTRLITSQDNSHDVALINDSVESKEQESTVAATDNITYQKTSGTPPVVSRPVFGQSIADFSNDRALVGSAHNIFIGTVAGQSKEKIESGRLETQFDVVVVDNIKGDLSGTVKVNQSGGYVNGVLHITVGDTPFEQAKKEGELLQPGTTYLFVTRYSPKYNWHTMNPYPEASVVVSKETLPQERLKALSNENKRVQELRAAYPNEILLDADIKNNNTRNSYKSIQ